MNLYDYRKRMHKIYNDSIYGNIKGDIYNELSDLRIDNDYIISVTTDNNSKKVTFEITIEKGTNIVNDLLDQIKEVIKSFIEKNDQDIDEDFRNFLSSSLTFDKFVIRNDENKLATVIIQL